MDRKYLLICSILSLSILCLQAQPQPDCIAEKTKGTILQFKGRITLADNRTTYKFTSKSKDCSSCATSVMYTNDDCVTIASFALFCKDCAPVITIASGFSVAAFPEGQKGFYADYLAKNNAREKKDTSHVVTQQKSVEKKSITLSDKTIKDYTFRTPARFIITGISDTTLGLFKLNDQLFVHTPIGLKHYHNGKMVNQYKIEPREITEQSVRTISGSLPPYKTVQSIINKRVLVYFMGGSINRFLKLTPTALFISQNSYLKYDEQTIIPSAQWVKQYSVLEKKS